MLFELPDSDVGNAEALWGEWVTPETVRLDNIPLIVFGVSMGDTVNVSRESDAPRFAGVAERGGHSTYRVMLEDPGDPLSQARLRDLVRLGCRSEQLTPRFIAIDVPPNVDVFKVYELLERGLDAGAWTFEEGHCGHPVEDSN